MVLAEGVQLSNQDVNRGGVWGWLNPGEGKRHPSPEETGNQWKVWS